MRPSLVLGEIVKFEFQESAQIIEECLEDDPLFGHQSFGAAATNLICHGPTH